LVYGICLGNNQNNFQLHRFTVNENIANSFKEITFLTHTVVQAGCSGIHAKCYTEARHLGPVVCAADLPGGRALCSAGYNRLVVPSVKLSTVGSPAFQVAAAQLCNSLPDDVDIVLADSLSIFRRQLKHYLFQQS